MTAENDIVTRLREQIPIPLEVADKGAPAHLIAEAADEIERWRKIADDLAYLYRHTVGLEGAYAPALMAYERAKNG